MRRKFYLAVRKRGEKSKKGRIMKRTTMAMVAIFAAFLLMSSVSYAQIRTGSIMGTVKDAKGEILPGVTVELSGEKLLGGLRSTITNEKGKFRFPNVMPGEYEITVALEGFQTAKFGELRENAGRHERNG